MPAPDESGAALLQFTPEQAVAVAELHSRCFAVSWTAADFHRFAALAAYPGVTAWLGERLIGFVVLSVIEPEAEILTLCIDKELRGRRFASAMLTRLIEDAAAQGVETLFLEVGVRNEPARALYTRHGFIEAGRRTGYYRTDRGAEDAIVMRLSLPGPMRAARGS
ncbi:MULTISPECIES: ribosomal protein S18-alanine N-acetyltransferase [Rhodomicrobium]|uniref:ribosomal protein S18-alanine N-acetyltransferase n=1 Tax=Rhodomicrobium TaxID=1068 RepID=UPI001481DB01|nr:MULTISPECIES: ribosomal protein S18-alanine N-acetyltransferase [Rhodomicrobium]